ncbi:hypothetical protein RDI58_006169 [Solanum bulbocastanum]|uniref:Uncharacterized protein n=1 Tax=Solanum bulbocastanum TaxID=147425 RepID=A0AAN8U891_SOLBU
MHSQNTYLRCWLASSLLIEKMWQVMILRRVLH